MIFFNKHKYITKRNLLFIDRSIPQFDKDAGSKSIHHWLRLFKYLGFDVTFIGDDFLTLEPYTTILSEMGINILIGNYYAENFNNWLKNNGHTIDFVILSRPQIAEKYIDVIKEYTNAKIFYFGIDLHYLRIERESLVANKNEYLLIANKLKDIEYAIMKKVDIVYYYSSKEISIINSFAPDITCKVIPLFIFPKDKVIKFDTTRDNLLFVGNFEHSPNVDGFNWFANMVLPLVKKTIPEILLYVIGSNFPFGIKLLESDSIKILGHVDENTLNEYYKKCRICVVSLRYGAGVKGKILEALYYQIPIITTTIGVEGLPGIEKSLVIEDDHIIFSEKLISMYNNNKILKKLVKNGHQYIIKNFTSHRAINIIKRDFF